MVGAAMQKEGEDFYEVHVGWQHLLLLLQNL